MTRARHGFTLLELMAVVMIMGVILLAIVPAIDNLIPGYKLDSSARGLASHIELVQGQAIATRQQYLLVYDLDERSYWIVFPEEPEAQPEEQTTEEEQPTEDQRPVDDVEHGAPPPTEEETEKPEELPSELDLANREALEPEVLPDGIEFVSVTVGEEERTTGRVVVPFTHLGDQGGHVVGVRLIDDTQTQQWVKFNPLSRSIDYSPQRPEARTLEGAKQ
ncbi:MAG: prepilin-type N-terminal cleavage/methylation domain-containing protein [Planctomycetes bacterium]|nr:prepilin-type N-terminal cleavage/methylation domain-containing protein [Planctomycetota bacterium]